MFSENGSFSSAVPQYPVKSALKFLCDALSLPYFERHQAHKRCTFKLLFIEM